MSTERAQQTGKIAFWPVFACAFLAMAAPGAAVRADALSDLTTAERRFDTLYAEGRYREAEPFARKMLSIAERSFNDKPQVVVWGLQKLADVLWRLDRYTESEPLYKHALVIREKEFGPEHSYVAETLNGLALLRCDQGRYAEAEQLYKRAIKIWEKPGESNRPNLAMCLSNLGLLLVDQDRCTEAQALYKRALTIGLNTVGPNDPGVADCLGNLGYSFYRQGRYAEAEPLYKRALTIDEKALGPEHPNVAVIRNLLAALLDVQGRDAEAEPLYKRALAIREKTLGPEHRYVAESLINLASLINQQGRHAEAQSLYQRALAINEKALGPEHREVALTLSHLAFLLLEEEHAAEARPLLERALAIREKALGPEHSDVATSLVNLARLDVEQNRAAGAVEPIDRAIAILDHLRAFPTLRCYGYYWRARASWSLGRKVDAIRDLWRALEQAEQSRIQSSGAETEKAQSFGRFAEEFELLVAWQAELGDVEQALAAVERSRARSLVDQLEMGGGDLLAGLPPDEANRLRQRDTAAKVRFASLEKQASAAETEAGLSDAERAARRKRLVTELAVAREEIVEVYRDIRNISPACRLSAGRDFKPVSLAVIQSTLRPRGALTLEYFFGADAGYLFIIPAEGEARLEKLGISDDQARALGVESGPLTIEQLKQVLSAHGTDVVELLSDPNTVSQAAGRLAALWTLLVPQAERDALTRGDVKELVVIPDGALALLPFETLVVEPGESPKCLLDVGPPVLYAPSATVLLNLAGRPAGNQQTKPVAQPVLTVANPVYGGQQQTPGASTLDLLATRSRYDTVGGHLAPLPHSGTESSWVSDVYKDQGIASAGLRAGQATEANVRFNVPGRRVLHFACHGLTDQKYGNFFGALALTPGKQASTNPADDGYLTLPEIYELDLKSCELAILSACETNFGPQQQGEGVWALSRGFLVAGARRVVASDWLVDDEAAASLVSYFCASLAKAEANGEAVDHAAALHQAKRWVRRQEKWRSPYYWGTFVLVGPN